MGKAANKKAEVAAATTSDRLYAFSDASRSLFASYAHFLENYLLILVKK